MKKTKFIAFEGIDGSGKTVQMDILLEKITQMGYKADIVSFPVYDSFFGKQVGSFLAGEENVTAKTVDPKSMALWYAMDRWAKIQESDFSTLDYVLLNRFTLSNAVYQSIRCEAESEADMIKWVHQLEHHILKLPEPDVYVIFNVNPAASCDNVSKKEEREYLKGKKDVYESSEEIMSKAQQGYLKAKSIFDNVEIVECLDNNSMKSMEEISRRVLEVLHKRNILTM